ncbi:hypothetical protein ACRAWF_40670, partial [Streptomyces sp. L7]
PVAGTDTGSAISSELLGSTAPWRSLRRYRGRWHYSGAYWAATTQGHMIYESRLEPVHLLFADFDPSVSGIVAQPFLLKAVVDGNPGAAALEQADPPNPGERGARQPVGAVALGEPVAEVGQERCGGSRGLPAPGRGRTRSRCGSAPRRHRLPAVGAARASPPFP